MESGDFLNRGERLKQERKRLNLSTQEDLAKLLGVKKNSIVRYEKHNAPLKQHHLTIMKNNGFDVDFILGGEETPLSELGLSDDQIKILSLFEQVPEEMQAGLISIIEVYANQFK
ncbi:helix-turn-helix domain-containing protein [Acinetobacter sp. TGL-Y2]|uniref:helix-turn-helix domain-containing protein n=1 Tax=Acinetobacter sp. TGL-Y2 TaxID=1407071 RepID=UPI001903DEB2|nr:helix-turn-helix domain-containing protein [Acinetobacter sp. TGL-Y2]MBJ9370581.1 helix-turn-helix domain-containing protein [Acinetobacter sp. TGL-Y2]